MLRFVMKHPQYRIEMVFCSFQIKPNPSQGKIYVSMKTKFVLRPGSKNPKAPLYLHITGNSKRERLNLDLHISKDLWNERKQKLICKISNSDDTILKDVSDTNLILDNLLAKITNIKTVYRLSEQVISPSILKKELIDGLPRVNFCSYFKFKLEEERVFVKHGTYRKLKSVLKDRTSVFVGQSGVGKSSLVKTLLPGVDIEVGELSEKYAEGMNTTTIARLFHFPHGGELIDSPGVREFGLWHMEQGQVLDGFIEFRPFLGRCKFRNCKHHSEPGCELQAALVRGDISERRLASFEVIVSSLKVL